MSADNLLLLPGMMCDERLFAAQLAAFDLPTVVGDLGLQVTIPDIAAAVLEHAPDSFAMAGLSMGGIVAFEIWRQAPERVTHLALIDTNPHADTPEKRTMRLDQIGQVLSGQLRQLAIGSLKPAYLAKANRDNDALLDEILAMALDQGADVFERQSLALKDRADSVATLSTITCPTVVLCGREDRVCPVEYHELMATEIPDAELVILDDCGHLATMEQPEAVNAALRRLLER